MNFEIIVRYIK